MRSPSAARGSALLEVVVALCLFSLAVVPLWTSLASERAAAVRTTGEASKEPAYEAAAPESQAWTWGAPQVRDGRWERADTLAVRVESPAGPEPVLVGIWWDGLFQGETDASPGVWTPLDVAVRQPLPVDVHVVVRARTPGGPWGVPWRTQAPSAAASPIGDAGPVGTMSGWITMHLPGAGGSDARVEDHLGATTVPVAIGGPSPVLAVAPGPVSVVLGGLRQDLTVETGRHADLYF